MSKEVIGKLFKTVVQGAFQQNQQRKAEKKQAAQASAGRSNVMVNVQSNNDPIYPLYGRQRIGGTRAYVEASNGAGARQGIDADGEATNTTHLNLILAMCEGEIAEIEQLWFNDTIVWDSAVNGTKTTLASGGFSLENFMAGTKYSGAAMYIAWYPGSETQTVDTTVSSSVGAAAWGTSNRLRGISYLAMKLTASEKFGGQLPTFNATLAGKKILNVSTLTNGDTLADMLASNYVYTSDSNPADVLYDYLISQYYGKGLDRTANETWTVGTNINLASFKQARIDCDAARSGAGYPINGFLQTEKQIFTNIGEIMEVCNGMTLFVDGFYEFRIKKKNEEVAIPSSAIFDKKTIIGEIALSLPVKASKLNKITGTFNNAAKKWNDDLVLFKSDAYILEDNGSVLEEQEEYTMITNATYVTDLITQMAEQSRDMFTVNFTAAHVALLLKSGDVIEVRNDDLGWGLGAGLTRKYFRVQELKLSEDNNVDITATTYNSALEL
jgi:hypothetical protein